MLSLVFSLNSIALNFEYLHSNKIIKIFLELKHVSIIYFLFLLLLKFRYLNMFQWKIIIRFNIFNLMFWSLCWIHTRTMHLNPNANKRYKTFPSSKNVPDKQYKLIFLWTTKCKRNQIWMKRWNKKQKWYLHYLEYFKCYLGFQ